MTEAAKFINPEVAESLSPKLSGISSGELNPLRRAIQIKEAIKQTADEVGMHPFMVLSELRTAQSKSLQEALGISKERVSRYAYVGDIHGFTEQKMAEIAEPLLEGSFDQIFFMGDVGGSAKLARIQRLFYQGGDSPDDNLMWNRYKKLSEANADDATILEELRPGIINVSAYEKMLGDLALSEAQAKQQVSSISDSDLLTRIKWVGSHKHFGHYVSDLPDSVIESLAADVRENYERFGNFAKQIAEKTGAKIYVLEGNWDARLPFDFERNTPDPVALHVERRRLYAGELLRKIGIHYYSGIDAVETEDSMHILVPFDSLTKQLTESEIAVIKDSAQRARLEGKAITLVAHAVPSWEIHNNLSPNNEGKTTAANLLNLIGLIGPDEIAYGHEHFVRKDENGILLSADTKYRIRIVDGQAVIEGNESAQDLSIDDNPGGTIASPVPMSDQLKDSRIAVSEKLKDTSHNHNVIRGRGGKASPIRVDRPFTKLG